MRLFENASYPFIQWRKRAYIVTGILFALAIGAMAMNVARNGSWLNYGVDFRGGSLVQLETSLTTVTQLDPINVAFTLPESALGSLLAAVLAVLMPYTLFPALGLPLTLLDAALIHVVVTIAITPPSTSSTVNKDPPRASEV